MVYIKSIKYKNKRFVVEFHDISADGDFQLTVRSEEMIDIIDDQTSEAIENIFISKYGDAIKVMRRIIHNEK